MTSIRIVYLACLASLVITTLLPLSVANAYYGRHSVEAELTYVAEADVPFEDEASAKELNHEGDLRTRMLEQVDRQVQHLMGTFQSESFRKDFGWPGVLGESYRVRFKNVEAGSAPDRKRVSYEFKGTVVFQKEAFSGHESRIVPITLPLASDLVYGLGLVGPEGSEHNACTDEHYNSEGDFWYFWDPQLKGCPLKRNVADIVRTQGRLVRLPNTRLAYPEYDRLYGDNGNGEAVDIAVFYGYIDYLKDLRNPRRRDDGARAMREVEAGLKERGFNITEKRDAFREYSDGRVFPGVNFLRKYEKRVQTETGNEILVRVQIMLADTAVESRDATFHRYLVPAFQNADLVVYDGHSGLGGNLDLRSLPDFKFDSSKYQVFFFNGCSSYPYFNSTYFEAKGGSRNLEILLSGLPTYTATAGANGMAFLDNFIDGRTLSYQTILRGIETSNGDFGTYLTGVTGEEDNRWMPGSHSSSR